MIEFKREKLELMHDAKIVALYKDYLKTPRGNIVEYDLVKHKSGGGAGVLLIDDKEYTYLIRQYRNTIDRTNLEIPAGGYSYIGEPGESCAVREAQEETGYYPQNIYHVNNIISSVGAYDEKTDIFIGTNLVEGIKKPDPDEYIELVHVSVEDAIAMIYSGEIIDSKTVIALFAYKDMKQRGIII